MKEKTCMFFQINYLYQIENLIDIIKQNYKKKTYFLIYLNWDEIPD